jgi:hypothetical protein
MMEHDRPGWRIRIRSVMLLVFIGALASALIVERWKKRQVQRRFTEEALRSLSRQFDEQAKTR